MAHPCAAFCARVGFHGRRPLGISRATAHAPFWQTRFHDFKVWTEKKRVEKLRYMHRNPVKRGLAETREDWRWSSYRFYLLDESGPVRMNEGWGKISFREHAA